MSIMSIDGNIVAERLTSLRKSRGMSKMAVANEVGISYVTMLRYEGTSGHYNELKHRSIAIIEKLADYYGVSSDYICGIEEKPSKTEDASRPQDKIETLNLNLITYNSNRLSFLRKRNRLSVKQVGELAGVCPITVSKYERGAVKKPLLLADFAKFYNVPLDYILGRSELNDNEGWIDGPFESIRHKWSHAHSLKKRDKVIILRRLFYNHGFQEIADDIHSTRQGAQASFGTGMARLFNEMSDEDLSKILTIIKPYLKEAN